MKKLLLLIFIAIIPQCATTPKDYLIELSKKRIDSCMNPIGVNSKYGLAIVGYSIAEENGIRYSRENNGNIHLISEYGTIVDAPTKLVLKQYRENTGEDLADISELQKELCGSVNLKFLNEHEYYRNNYRRIADFYEMKKRLMDSTQRIEAYEREKNKAIFQNYQEDKIKLDSLFEKAKPHMPDYYTVVGKIFKKDKYSLLIQGTAVSKNNGINGKCSVVNGYFNVIDFNDEQIIRGANYFNSQEMICLKEEPAVFSGNQQKYTNPNVTKYLDFKNEFQKKYQGQNIENKIINYNQLKKEIPILQEKVKSEENDLKKDMRIIRILYPDIDNIEVSRVNTVVPYKK